MTPVDQLRDFFRQFSAESAPQIIYYAESAASCVAVQDVHDSN